VTAIWLLRRVLFADATAFHHRFEVVDRVHGVQLSDHFAIHTLELPRFRAGPEALDAEGRWAYFFKEAHAWTALPAELEHPVMRKAMNVLEQISDKSEDYWAYQARQKYLRDRETTRVVIEQMQTQLAQAEADKAQAEADKAQAEAREAQAEADKAQAEADKARLAEALRAAGIDPNAVLGAKPEKG